MVVPAPVNGAVTGEVYDEHEASLPTLAAGSYSVAFRFRLDDGPYLYCDLSGSEDGFGLASMTVVRVFPSPPADPIDYCNLLEASLSASAGGSAPSAGLEAYENGITDPPDAFSDGDLEVEIGYGSRAANPAFATTPAVPGEYAWRDLPHVGQRPGEDAAEPGIPRPHRGRRPLAGRGLRRRPARVRRSGSSVWSYCDSFNGTMDLLWDRITDLTVDP